MSTTVKDLPKTLEESNKVLIDIANLLFPSSTSCNECQASAKCLEKNTAHSIKCSVLLDEEVTVEEILSKIQFVIERSTTLANRWHTITAPNKELDDFLRNANLNSK